LSDHTYNYPSVNSSIHTSIHLTVHLTFHSSIHPSVHPFIYPSTRPPINPSSVCHNKTPFHRLLISFLWNNLYFTG